ncbi:hypothetical protein F5Y07DRAFT_362959 [Xylaria sp. FL0933]|nr:hypothetical protein F5Y07DRAFT_362959 [Xylaria sp. FL0933]
MAHDPKDIKSPASYRRNSRLVRLFRLQSATIYLVWVALNYFWGEYKPFIFTCPLIFWDLVGFACTRNTLSTIPLEINMIFEIAFFGSFIYLNYLDSWALAQEEADHFSGDPCRLLGVLLGFLILEVGALYIYLDIRAFPRHWRYKRDYRKMKPFLVFTETGSPVAVFPPSRETIVQRLSVDSLQHTHTDQNDYEMLGTVPNPSMAV